MRFIILLFPDYPISAYGKAILIQNKLLFCFVVTEHFTKELSLDSNEIG